MATHTTTINGINVELETFTENGEPRSFCTLSKLLSNGTEYVSSLTFAEDQGGLAYASGPGAGYPANAYGEESYPLSNATIHRITEWAEAWLLKSQSTFTRRTLGLFRA